MTAQATLPPITIEHAIGLAGDRNEPVTADHLNTGISAADAQAYTLKAIPYPTEVDGFHRAASIVAFAGAALGHVAALLLATQGRDQAAVAAIVLVGVGILAVAASIALGRVASRRKRRYAESFKGFAGAALTILRTQDKLIALPFISAYDHYAVVTAMQKDLELSRVRLMDHAGDGRSPLVGEPELLAALGALGDYARTEHPTDQQYTTARDAARAFINLQEGMTGQLTSTASKRNAAL